MTIWLAAVALGIAGTAFAGMAFGGWKPRQMRRAAGSAPGFRLALPRFAPRLPYERKPLLTAWERRALLSMRAQLPPGFYVCPQVRLADMLRIGGADRMGRMAALGKVASKSVDFAVVELTSGDVVLVVELDDRSHDQAGRRERDRFVNSVLEYSGIPVRRFRPDTPIHIRDFFEAPGASQARA
jgi:hypothetical protein